MRFLPSAARRRQRWHLVAAGVLWAALWLAHDTRAAPRHPASGRPAAGLRTIESAAADRTGLHQMNVEIVGTVARVEVRRRMLVGTLARDRAGRRWAFDVDLPEGAQAESWEMRPAGGDLTPPLAARPALLPPAHADKLAPIADAGADRRMWLDDLHPDAIVDVRLVYHAPLFCDDGRFVLRVPGSVDLSPTAAAVQVSLRVPGSVPPITGWQIAGTLQDLARRRNVRRARGRAMAPRRAPWEITFSLAGVSSQAGVVALSVPALIALGGAVRGSDKPTPIAAAHRITACRTMDLPFGAFPAQVLALVDVSRSVGAAGLAAQRDALLTLARALPPETRMGVTAFDRESTPLFPFPRLVTDEMLTNLRETLVSSRLRNGTRFGAAFDDATAQVRMIQADRRAERESSTNTPAGAPAPTVPASDATWIVVLTDGALPSAPLSDLHAPGSPADAAAGDAGDAAALDRLLSRAVDSPVVVSMAIVRPDGDEPPNPMDVLRLHQGPRRSGGVTRVIAASEITRGITDLVTDVRRGGDLHDLTIAAGAHTPPVFLAATLPPGRGLAGVVDLAGRSSPSPKELSFVRAGQTMRVPVHSVRWPWHADRKRRASGALPAPQVQVVLAPAQPEGTDDRGELERSVVRNTLSLAFLPRVRACYLTRKVTDRASIHLQGRVRLALFLERGELQGSQILESELQRPDIEACIREAAWELYIPRPMRRDHPVTAVLNLVFRPRTPERPEGDDPALIQEIDLILGPVTFPSDPGELLPPEGTHEGAPAQYQDDASQRKAVQ